MNIIRGLSGGLVWSSLICSLGCSSFSYSIKPPSLSHKDGASYIDYVSPVAQKSHQCGPAALESVMRHWGKDVQADAITRELYQSGSRGVLNFMLAQYARNSGFWTETGNADISRLKSWILKDIPVIVMVRTGPPLLWVSNYHFVVVKGFDDADQIFYANTGKAETQAIPYLKFEKRWKDAGNWYLIICPPEKVDWELEANEAGDLGFLLEDLNQLEIAEKWYQYSLKKNPEKQVIQFNLANIFLKTRRWDEAEKLYIDLLKEKPEWGPLSNNLAWVYIQKGQYQKAVTVIEDVLKKGAPRQYDILDTLGLAYCKSGQAENALRCFQEALQKVPADHFQAIQEIEEHSKNCEYPSELQTEAGRSQSKTFDSNPIR